MIMTINRWLHKIECCHILGIFIPVNSPMLLYSFQCNTNSAEILKSGDAIFNKQECEQKCMAIMLLRLITTAIQSISRRLTCMVIAILN